MMSSDLPESVRDLSLVAHAQNLAALRAGITELQIDTVSLRDGTQCVDLVDFSEVFSYLSGEPEEGSALVDHDGSLGLDRQYRLGLAHLFGGARSQRVYLLPPHVTELLRFVRTQQRQHQELDRELERGLVELLADQRAASLDGLLPLAGSAQRVDALFEEVFALVGDRFLAVSALIVASDARRLAAEELLRHRLRFELSSLCRELDIDPERVRRSFDRAMEIRVVDLFPARKRRAFPDNTVADARCLLFLRELSASAPTGRTLCFFTRDRTLCAVAEKLDVTDPPFWGTGRSPIRGIRTLFLDAALRDLPLLDRLRWLEETLRVLPELEQNVREALLVSGTPSFLDAQSKVLSENAAAWDRCTSQLLSLGLERLEWLRSALSEQGRGGTHERRSDQAVARRRLQSLYAVIRDRKYRNRAYERQPAPWAVLHAGVLMTALFNTWLGEDAGKSASMLFVRIVDEGLGALALQNGRSALMPLVHFKSQAVADLLTSVQEGDRARLDALGEHAHAAIAQLGSGEGSAEDRLLVAFVFGLFERWREAELVLEPVATDENPEVLYFRGYVQRRAYKSEKSRPIEALIQAFRSVANAVACQPRNERYLLERATTALMFHDDARAAQYTADAGVLDRAAAIHDLEYVSETSEGEEASLIRLRALNNLAYAEARSPTLTTQRLRWLLQRLEAENPTLGEFRLGMDDAAQNKWAFVLDTVIYVRATIAFQEKDVAALRVCIDEWRCLVNGFSDATVEYDRVEIERHFQEWQRIHAELLGKGGGA